MKKMPVQGELGQVAVRSIFKELPSTNVDVLAVRTALKSKEPAFLMEIAARSYLFLQPRQTLSIRAGALRIQTEDGEQIVAGNPLQALQAHLEHFRQASQNVPPFAAGAAGYIGYDCVQYLENIPLPKVKSPEEEACLILFGEAVIVDHQTKTTYLVANVFAEVGNPQYSIDRLERAVLSARPVVAKKVGKAKKGTDGLDRKGFTKALKVVKDHILDGDIFQCVLSQRMEYALPAKPLDLYQTLREVSPSPYQFYFESKNQTLLGSSPEMLVKVTGRQAETCPIAGTRPRGKTPALDKKLERQLLRSPKETAEHVMLVDLSRNDLGRVCRPGTVRVRDFSQVQRFSHVMHLVSTVEGELVDGKTALSALFASFPAGTLTGAPKIRAMEIISSLETRRRGAYGGAVVLYDFMGNLDSCIAIRSLLIKKGRVSVQAGAGIVADSTAKREIQEIEHKSAAARRALVSAAGGR